MARVLQGPYHVAKMDLQPPASLLCLSLAIRHVGHTLHCTPENTGLCVCVSCWLQVFKSENHDVQREGDKDNSHEWCANMWLSGHPLDTLQFPAANRHNYVGDKGYKCNWKSIKVNANYVTILMTAINVTKKTSLHKCDTSPEVDRAVRPRMRDRSLWLTPPPSQTKKVNKYYRP